MRAIVTAALAVRTPAPPPRGTTSKVVDQPAVDLWLARRPCLDLGLAPRRLRPGPADLRLGGEHGVEEPVLVLEELRRRGSEVDRAGGVLEHQSPHEVGSRDRGAQREERAVGVADQRHRAAYVVQHAQDVREHHRGRVCQLIVGEAR